jgi:predicted acetyltransferase
MRDIRVLAPDDLDGFVNLSVNAYPGMRVSTPAERERMRERVADGSAHGRFTLYGVYEGDALLGVMRYHDFRMKVLSTRTLVGGLGGVAVDLLHKKDHVAFDMVQHFVHHYRDRGACLTALYPFRPDFYVRMGFGYGTKMSHYRVLPAALPAGPTKARVDFLSCTDSAELAACYDRQIERTNGLIERPTGFWARVFDDPTVRVVGVRRDGGLGGYLVFRFALGPEDNFIKNDLAVAELVYDTPEDLGELLAFLRSQADQVERVLVNTQDEDFHVLLGDPRDGTGDLLPRALAHATDRQGVGIMYRVVDVPRLFAVLADHDFGGQTIRLRLGVTDTFLPENSGATVVHFEGGHARLVAHDACDVELALDVSDLSSLVVGAVGLRSLVRYGRARISEPRHVETVARLFAAPRPLCWTDF